MPHLGRVIALLSLLLALPLAAQTIIQGRVTLPDGSPLPGVTVSIDDPPITVVTDADGHYRIVILAGTARGIVNVTAALEGFQSRTASVDASRGDVTHDFTLRVSFGQQITVGSRAIGAEKEKAVPVVVFPQEHIATAASSETSQILQKLTPSLN